MTTETIQKTENQATANGRSLPISTKFSIEIGKHIRGMSTKKAKTILEKVVTKEYAIPYTRFNADRGHKKATGPGGYPVSAAKNILMLIKSAESNAADKGMNAEKLYVKVIIPNQASRGMRAGGRETKSTHISVVLEEQK